MRSKDTVHVHDHFIHLLIKIFIKSVALTIKKIKRNICITLESAGSSGEVMVSK